jgi:hypothetical protein
VKRFGLTAVGVQYQQGLKDSCAASDFAEGAIGNAERFPIPDENGEIVCPDAPIPCINEVDMGSAIPQVMLAKLLGALGMASETTFTISAGVANTTARSTGIWRSPARCRSPI